MNIYVNGQKVQNGNLAVHVDGSTYEAHKAIEVYEDGTIKIKNGIQVFHYNSFEEFISALVGFEALPEQVQHGNELFDRLNNVKEHKVLTWKEYREMIRTGAKNGVPEAILDEMDNDELILMSKYLYDIIYNELALVDRVDLSVLEGIPVDFIEKSGYVVKDGFVYEGNKGV